jgi:hypothetical protein
MCSQVNAQKSVLLDQLVGAGEQRGRDGTPVLWPTANVIVGRQR